MAQEHPQNLKRVISTTFVHLSAPQEKGTDGEETQTFTVCIHAVLLDFSVIVFLFYASFSSSVLTQSGTWI